MPLHSRAQNYIQIGNKMYRSTLIFLYMKSKIFFWLGILFMALSCNKIKIKNDLEKNELRGKVKSVKENYYEPEEKFGEIIKGEKCEKDVNGFEIGSFSVFNQKGYLVEVNNTSGLWNELVFNPMLNINKAIFHYDKSGVLKTVECFDKVGNKRGLDEYFYDKKGRIIELNEYEHKTLNYKVKIKYKKGLIERSIYDREGRLCYKTETKEMNGLKMEVKDFLYEYDKQDSTTTAYTYDKKGNIAAMTRVNHGDISSHKYYYNDKNLCIKEIDSSNYGLDIYRFEYKYDSNNNWIQKISIENGKPYEILERIIKYY